MLEQKASLRRQASTLFRRHVGEETAAAEARTFSRVHRRHMGAGASAIPVGKYSAELQKPKDGSDLYETGDYEFAKSEAERLLRELGKYVEDRAVVGLDSSLKSITSSSDENENFRACVNTISHIRRLLHKTTGAANRARRKRRLSNAGKNLLFKGIAVVNDDSEDEEDLDEMLDMSNLRK